MAGIDRRAIEERGIAGLFLMEKAGEAVARHLLSIFSAFQLSQTVILCGKGNNGGDGFVIARCLAQAGYRPQVVLAGQVSALKGDALIQFRYAVEAGVPILECATVEAVRHFFVEASPQAVWIDALLGTGFQGTPQGAIAEAIALLNRSRGAGQVVAVDIPSGVDADTGAVPGEAVDADTVYTMGLPKIGHVLPPGLNHTRTLHVLDIGFPRDLLVGADSEAELLADTCLDAILPRRSQSAHKGSEGHLLIVAGSRGMTGAALLCAKAAIEMGAGLVTSACPGSLLPIYANGVWEMLTQPVAEIPEGGFAEEAFEALFSGEARYRAVVVGPGLSRHPAAMALVRRIAEEVPIPVVFDGDALFALSPDRLAERAGPWIVTPHPGEMARLMGCSVAAIQADRWGYARRLAAAGGVVVLKGPKTVIASTDAELWINPTGCPEMASGGMGDVLAGMIGALCARGLAPRVAAAAGAYLHGRAAQLYVEETGAEAMRAGTVISWIAPAMASIRSKEG
ncbi:MAG: NAD(P)H-hydrate dehydratase [bacterium]|nr:NAD(P)H-hydrate dehydratase [bacterium]